jgi:hypothetical protein
MPHKMGDTMPFVDLNRCFVPIGKDQEPMLDAGIWGRRFAGWLDWPQLLENRRVVLLAEALSGKTEEFRNQQSKLSSEGKPAFFIRIEELADQGFEAALEPSSANAFEEWRNGSADAFFFLDSVDEARLNRKSFETALKRFARDLERAVERARVFISCRVTDWKGREDRGLVEQILPSFDLPQESSASDDPLLDPIFNKEEKATSQREKQERKPNELLVVQIVPMSKDQCRSLVETLGVSDPDAFMQGIVKSGLDAFTERPGDIIDLADYWKSYGRLGSHSEMVEHGINRKLDELDAYRSDNNLLTPAKAREGAERIAAALTLGKSFTLRAPGHDPDPSLASGALEPSLILNDWSDAAQTALLRRGIFAPSTYGRIRFHHRTTQEYLTAQWLDGLLRSNCPRDEIWDLIFSERYGVETVVPSLRPAAAWLSQRYPELRDEIIRREPLILIRHGDPASLPLDAKKRVLLSYAEKHARAEISDDGLDNRALWLFTEQGLAGTIRECWMANQRTDFRMDMLRMIRERGIANCLDIARDVASDTSFDDYHRIVALQAMAECNDAENLRIKALELIANRAVTSAYLASNFASALFPQYLTVEELFAVIADHQQPAAKTVDGFEYTIDDLYKACPDGESRKTFISSLAELCLSPPFSQEWQRVSARYVDLAKRLGPIAKAEVKALGGHGAPIHVVRLLMAAERAERNHSSDEGPTIFELVRANTDLNRALFWADVGEQRQHGRSRNENPIRFWQVFIHGETFWHIGQPDLSWLMDDLIHRPREEDKRIALSAIVSVLLQEKRLDVELPSLHELVSGNATLLADLSEYTAPRPVDERLEEHEAERRARQRERDRQQEEHKAGWVRFGQYLREHLNQLRDPEGLSSWRTGAFRLWHLSEWLGHRMGRLDENSYRQWRLLEEGFGRDVAEAYRDGMKVLWRVMKPERPKHRAGGPTTTKYTTILAFQAVAIEAAEDPDWTSKLTEAEAKLAAQHGCMSEQGFPEWIDGLIAAYPQAVLPIVKKAVEREWSSPGPGRADFLLHYGRSDTVIQPALQNILFDIVSHAEPSDLYKLDRGLQLISRLRIGPERRKLLARTARRRLTHHERRGKPERAMRYLALLLVIDPENAVSDLGGWLYRPKRKDRRARAEQTFAFLFDRHDPVLPGLLSGLRIIDLEQLLRLAYTYVRPQDDAVHPGRYKPELRDHAENARNTVLAAILDRSGEEAYRALRHLAASPLLKIRRERFEELARGMAERDSEIPEWKPAEVVALEQQHRAPVKTGSDLLRVVVSVLRDIQFQMDKGDVTSRPLIQRAQDEDEARNWLVEQMNARARGRFLAYREAQVANKDRPDIIIASNAAHCEVGMEVKHGGKKWTMRQLERALRVQLATDYLQPPTRRHGVFLITNHGPRRWRDSETRKFLTFDKLTAWLVKVADSVRQNDSGPVRIVAFGLDVTGPTKSI